MSQRLGEVTSDTAMFGRALKAWQNLIKFNPPADSSLRLEFFKAVNDAASHYDLSLENFLQILNLSSLPETEMDSTA